MTTIRLFPASFQFRNYLFAFVHQVFPVFVEKRPGGSKCLGDAAFADIHSFTQFDMKFPDQLFLRSSEIDDRERAIFAREDRSLPRLNGGGMGHSAGRGNNS